MAAEGIQDQASIYAAKKITRHDFGKDFVFGCATSAYQVEGSHDARGKSMNNWDAYSLRRPYRIQDGSNGCVAIDQHNRFKEDVMHIKRLGLEAYRFSISWSRILPGGRLSSGVNREGVQYYNDLIDFCIEQELKPYVTIFHFDVPQCLEDEYGGFLSTKIVQDFAEFSEVCFWEFGDRVKYWITQNEPWTFAHNGYVAGAFPPGHGNAQRVAVPTNNPAVKAASCVPHRCCTVKRTLVGGTTPNPGDAGVEPYIIAHNLILAHAVVYDIYKTRYKDVQGGTIGVTNMTTWYVPFDENNPKDVAAAERAVDFMWGWFMSPIVHGDYPPIMRELVGERLPKFSAAQKKLVQGSYDFIGMNYYTTNYTIHVDIPPGTKPTYYTDQQAAFVTERNGKPIGPSPGSPWLFIVPEGIYNLLKHTKDKYNDPLIYITEHGMSITNDPDLPVHVALKDDIRVECYQDHLFYVKQAIDYGVNVKAYFLWSMFDNYEWAEGYEVRFGIIYVDFVNRLARYPKTSAIWWMNFLNKNILPRPKRQVLEIEENETTKRPKRARG